ncbi:MAG: two-component regulator propeller domain-containing protein [Bacteroidota bacterium]
MSYILNVNTSKELMARGYCLVLILFCHLGIYAQKQFSFRQLTVKEGLSQNSVVSVAQDGLGVLWLATQDGLNRYDGRSFKQYPFQFTDVTRPTFSRLGKVYVNRDGNVLIIPSDHNMYCYDREKDSFFRASDLSDVTVVWQDIEKDYWVGTAKGEIHRLDQDFVPLPLEHEVRLQGQVKKIGERSEKGLFILSEKSLILSSHKGEAFKEISLETLLGEQVSSNLSALAIDPKGTLWLGYHGDGLYYFDDATQSLRRLSISDFEGYLPQDLKILELFFDTKNRMWLTTYGDGMYLVDFNDKSIAHFSEQKQDPRALHYNDILCAFEDSSGTLWFGTDGAGASFYDADLEKFNSFTNYQTPANINIDVVRAITVNDRNGVWIGTSGKGLTNFEPATNSWSTYTTRNSDIPSDRIMSLYHNSNGELWIGTQGGGLSLLTSENRFSKHDILSTPPLNGSTIWDIEPGEGDTIWLGTRDNGLIQFHMKKGIIGQYQDFTVSDTVVTRKNITVVLKQDRGNLWLGTQNKGLIQFNLITGKASIFTTENSGLAKNAIKSLFLDKNEVLWIGTSGGGLDAYDTGNGTFHNFTVEDGLPNNVIYGILPDKTNHLWLSSNRGITKFSVDLGLGSQPEITNYDDYDGLATEFNTGAYYEHHDGELYFGGLEGFYWFDPQGISESKYLPRTALTEFKVLNEVKSVYLDTLLKHDQNTIDFTFSSLQFSEPEKNKYKYRLIPFEEDWVVSGNKNYVRYTHLPPDDYEFQVMSSNYDGKWNDNPENFNFTIAAPWYFNAWSKSLYGLLFLLTAVLFYRYLKWRWQMKLDLKLKAEEALRFKKLNDYKSKIYTDIAHEFRTPLTLISGPIESKLSESNISEEEVNKFVMMERNTSRLTNLVDQLLQLARLEEGKFQLNRQWGNLGLFLKSLAAAFEYEATQKNIFYEYKIQPIKTAYYDDDALDKIMVNLISNALKHGKANGKCQVLAEYMEDHLWLTVRNETDKVVKDVQKLFERFYQNDERTKGAGIGLSLVQKLVKLQDGKIVVEQTPTTIEFIVKLPMKLGKSNEQETPSSMPNGKEKTLQIGQAPILLLVEDNKDVLEFMVSEFGKTYQIITANNGESGIKNAIAEVPDIIISDVKMPVKDGIELCNTLKTDERTSHVPIILLTASSDKQNELRGLKAGADDYVTKPFKIKILEKRVDNLVKSRQLLRQRYSQEGFLKPKDIAITPTDELFLNRVQEVMDGHLANPSFNAAQFSSQVGMSRMQLHRKLMTYTGLSTSAFIRSQRLKQAVKILKTSDATINEVAYSVGFNTPSYFIKCFKEAYKKTPSEYLQSAK